MLWGGELVLRDGVAVGQVTSAAYATTLGRCVALAYVRDPAGGSITPEAALGGRLTVSVGGTEVPATAHARAPYDPGSERIRA